VVEQRQPLRTLSLRPGSLFEAACCARSLWFEAISIIGGVD